MNASDKTVAVKLFFWQANLYLRRLFSHFIQYKDVCSI